MTTQREPTPQEAHPFTPDALEKAAAALAEALHGGKWATHYTEDQKQVWRKRARAALNGGNDGSIRELTEERDRLETAHRQMQQTLDRLTAHLAKAEADCAMFAAANARQAMCISFTAANLGPEEYSATVEGLPKAARHVSAERDRLAEENARLRMMLDARDRFDAGEPSSPPATGNDARPLVADWRWIPDEPKEKKDG